MKPFSVPPEICEEEKEMYLLLRDRKSAILQYSHLDAGAGFALGKLPRKSGRKL